LEYYWNHRVFLCIILFYARTFPVIAQAEVKTILKSSGERFKRLREAGKPLYTMPAVAASISYAKEEATEEVATATNEEKVNELFENIGTFDSETQTADDLQKINGIGPVMERTLNEIGIFTFEQVSKMTEKEYHLLDEITESFPGRAQRDDWAGQAKALKK
jgi:predicted flap endonuclease-1-like 5' DNA nuclease